MFPSERKQKIMTILAETPAVKVTELSELFQVSEVTIRRDLQELEEAGLLKRTHGGAVSITAASFEPALIEKEEEHLEEKKAIARAALDLISEGDTILLDAGSTTLQLARLLKTSKKQLTVVTNALNIAWEISFDDSIDLILTGGHLRHRTLSAVGPVAENTLQGLYVDKVFLATNSLDVERGLSTPNIYEAQTKQRMTKAGHEIILLADHSKFGRISLGFVCPLTAIHRLITDAGALPADLARLREQGVEVIVAGRD